MRDRQGKKEKRARIYCAELDIWLYAQVDLCSILLRPTLSQEVLSILNDLASDIDNDSTRKVAWMTAVVTCLIPGNAILVLGPCVLDAAHQALFRIFERTPLSRRGTS